jgi:hypothetical protein
MSLLTAFALEPFSVNEPIIDSLCLEPNCMEVFIQGYKTDSGAAQLVNELETDVDLGTVSIL